MKRSGHTDRNAQAIPAALDPATTRYRGAERVERENTNRKGKLRWLDALIASARCEGLVIRWRGYVLARDRRAAAAPREAPPRGRTSGVRWGDRRVEGRSAAAANAKYYPTLPVLRALRRAKYSSAPSPPIHGTLNASPRCTWAWEAWASGGGDSERSGDVGPGTRMGDLSGRHGFLFPHVTRPRKFRPAHRLIQGFLFEKLILLFI